MQEAAITEAADAAGNADADRAADRPRGTRAANAACRDARRATRAATRRDPSWRRCQRPPGNAATWPSSSSCGQLRRDRLGGEPAARDQRVDVDRIVADASSSGAIAARWRAGAAGVRAGGRRRAASRSSSSTSCAVSTSFAPSRISLWQPFANGEWIEPGIANTSRPCSPAQRAVISEPDDSVASTTSTPRARPLISRLRRGKFSLQRRRAGREFGQRCRRAPRSRARGRDCAPDRRGRGPCRPRRACRRARSSAPRARRASMPSARPDTIVEPGVGERLRERARVVEALRRRVAAADDRERRAGSAARGGRCRRARAADRRSRAARCG